MSEGQYVGLADGEGAGLCVLNLDREPDALIGTAYLFPNDQGLPASSVQLRLNPNYDSGQFEGSVFNFNLIPGNVTAADNKTHPESILGRYIKGTYQIHNGNFDAEVHSDSGINFRIGLFNPENNSNKYSSIQADPGVSNWDDFQDKVRSLKPRKYIFRGQSEPWRLRTSFHRSRRSDLLRYWHEDIPTLHKQISHILGNNFELDNQKHVGAFFSLVQHHGYPTPLLDWSYSAYVATFFAYRSPKENDTPVRIYALDIEQWEIDNQVQNNVPFSSPHLSRMETLNIENPRQHAQQGLGTLTSVSDLEFFIKNKQTDNKTRYIYAFDLPGSDRERVLSELSMMGVTAASLFPGLDGACEALRGRLFGDLRKVGRETL